MLRRGIIAIFRVDLPGEDGAVEQASTTADSAHYPQSGSSPAGAQVSKVVRGIVGRLGGMAATFLRTQPIVSIPVELTKPRRGERGVDRSSSAKKAGTTSAQFRRTRRELGAHTGSLKPVVRVMLRDECAIDRPMSKAGWRGWTGPSASESSRNQRADADFTGVIVTVLNGRRNSVTEFAVDLADDPGYAHGSSLLFAIWLPFDCWESHLSLGIVVDSRRASGNHSSFSYATSAWLTSPSQHPRPLFRLQWP